MVIRRSSGPSMSIRAVHTAGFDEWKADALATVRGWRRVEKVAASVDTVPELVVFQSWRPVPSGLCLSEISESRRAQHEHSFLSLLTSFPLRHFPRSVVSRCETQGDVSTLRQPLVPPHSDSFSCLVSRNSTPRSGRQSKAENEVPGEVRTRARDHNVPRKQSITPVTPAFSSFVTSLKSAAVDGSDLAQRVYT